MLQCAAQCYIEACGRQQSLSAVRIVAQLARKHALPSSTPLTSGNKDDDTVPPMVSKRLPLPDDSSPLDDDDASADQKHFDHLVTGLRDCVDPVSGFTMTVLTR